MPGSDAILVIVRHGQTDWTDAGIFTGQTDIPLNAEGICQADAVAEAVASLGATHVASSDLLRAAQTARVVARTSGARLALDRRLREEDLGAWEGLTPFQVADRFPAEYERWAAGEVGPIGAREGLLAVAERACAAVTAALAGHRSPTLVAVTHVNTAVALIGRLTNLPPSDWPTVDSIGPAGYAVLTRRGRADAWVR